MYSDVFLKIATDIDDFINYGRLFHVCSPAKAKACLPNSDRGFGTIRLPADEERSRCFASTAVTVIYSSARSDGARLCRALYTVRHSLNSMHCGTRSQWRSCRTSDVGIFLVIGNDSRRSVHDLLRMIQIEIWQSSENAVAVVDSRQHRATR